MLQCLLLYHPVPVQIYKRFVAVTYAISPAVPLVGNAAMFAYTAVLAADSPAPIRVLTSAPVIPDARLGVEPSVVIAAFPAAAGVQAPTVES